MNDLDRLRQDRDRFADQARAMAEEVERLRALNGVLNGELEWLRSELNDALERNRDMAQDILRTSQELDKARAQIEQRVSE